MKLNDEELKFFENKNYLRKNYGVYYNLLLPLYKNLVNTAPTERERLFKDLQNVNFNYKPEEKIFGVTYRLFNTTKHIFDVDVRINYYNFNKKLQRIDKVTDLELENSLDFYNDLSDEADLNDENISPEIIQQLNDFITTCELNLAQDESYLAVQKQKLPQEVLVEYNKCQLRVNYLHEFLHALSKKSLYHVKDQKTYPHKKEDCFVNGDYYITKYGASFFDCYLYDKDKLNLYNRDLCALYKEEAIVDDWANELATDFGLKDKLNFNYKVNYPCAYGEIAYIAGMYEVIGNGEWRNQHLTGKVGKCVSLEKAKKMDDVFSDYIRSIVKNDFNKNILSEEIDTTKYLTSWVNLINYCEQEYADMFSKGLLTKDQIEKYEHCRACAFNSDNMKQFLRVIKYKDKQNIKAKIDEIMHAYDKYMNKGKTDQENQENKENQENQALNETNVK